MDRARTEIPEAGRRAEVRGLALLALACAFNAVLLVSELSIGQLPLNDSVLHLAASERLAESFSRGEPLLDPWVSEWSLGYPMWRSYQPLPHLVAAAVLRSSDRYASHAAAFAALEYVLLVLLPASVYGGARLMGANPCAAGLAALLVLAPAAEGSLDRWGLSYGATTWRGSGLYTQVFALHWLLWSWGLTVRALDTGRARALTGAALAATALSHIVFGYVAFLSAIALALVGPTGERARRLVRSATICVPALLLISWFVIPLVLARHEVNHSRWEDAYKWDSFGAPMILRELLSGRMFDAGRAPVLSLLVAAGALVAALCVREALPRRLLALAALWLALFFGRETWGHLLVLVGVPGDLHLHRVQAAFELGAVLLAAWGTERVVRVLADADRRLAIAASVLLAVALLALGRERARYLALDAVWGRDNLAAFAAERADLEAAFADVRAILAERPGRVSAGRAASWGKDFKIGAVQVYAFLTREHFDQASFLYHSMSLTSDVMVLRNENEPAHDVAFGVRAVVAPADRAMPAHLRLRGRHGRLAVYEASPEGYFGLVDVGARYSGPRTTFYEPSVAWLQSDRPRLGIVAALDPGADGLPSFGRWQPLPPAQPAMLAARGRVVSERKRGEVYEATLAVERPCHALLKVTWFPDLVATVDGVVVPLLRVTPGFAALPVPAGTHEVSVRYQPGSLKAFLLGAGLVLFALFAAGIRHWRVPAIEQRACASLAQAGTRISSDRARAAVAVALFALLALRPLFRGRLIDGHDALEYPPRLVEMSRAVQDGHLPPVWAPDLGNGHGQPLFEFAPPLPYVAALGFHAVGLRIVDSLQIALALLFAAGAAAVYGLGRRAGASRSAAVAGSAAWLFAPYVALDLYVRAAFAEASALAVAPLALLGLLRAIDRPSLARVMAGAAAVALVPLAHNGAALLIVPVLGFLAAARSTTAGRPLQALAVAGGTLIAGLGLSAFFWLPALAEKDFVKTDLLRQDFLRWGEHLISPAQLFWSRWGFGYSGPGTDDGMSFALGMVLLVLAVIGVRAGLGSADPVKRREAAALAAIALGGAWLATDWSAPIWSRVETLQYLAYPWRALLLPALALPLLAVRAFDSFSAPLRMAMLGVLVVSNLAHTEPKRYLTFDDEYYSPRSIAEKGLNTTTREEYEPRWVKVRPPYARQALVSRGAPIEVREGSSGVARREFTVRAPAAVHVEASTFFYPGWKVFADDREIAAHPTPVTGLIGFDLPPGEHAIRLELEPTPLRRTATLISMATLGLLTVAVGAAPAVRRALRSAR